MSNVTNMVLNTPTTNVSKGNMIYKKMSEVMRDIGSVSKDQRNVAQGFKFRGIDQFVNALYPALTRHGVFMTPRATQFNQEIKSVVRSSGKEGVDKHVHIMMEYDFYAEDGSKVTVGPIPAEGLDSGDKATNKALSAALKYALIQTFSVPTEDMAEADLDSPELGKPKSTPAPAKAAPEKAKLTTEEVQKAVLADIGKEELPPLVQPAVEPLKKSSFKKPKKVEATTEETSDWS